MDSSDRNTIPVPCDPQAVYIAAGQRNQFRRDTARHATCREWCTPTYPCSSNVHRWQIVSE